jgi:hypothetical protein
MRDTPRVAYGISSYQLLALGCVALGVHGYLRRAAERTPLGVSRAQPDEGPC